MRKEEGGMGFRNIYGFNLAMLGKQEWKFMSNPEAMVTRASKRNISQGGTFWTQ